MSKPKKTYKVSQVVSEAREKHPPIAMELDNGEVFEFDPPQFWNDDAADPHIGPKATMIAVLGEEQYQRYIAAGGTYSMINLVITAWAEDQGVDVGKSSASASS